jgi:hypothetical protein
VWPIKTSIFFLSFVAACALSLVCPIVGIVNYMMVIAGAAFAIILAPRACRKRVYASLIVGAIGAYSLTDTYFVDRMNSLLRPDEFASDSAIQGRLELWQAARDMFFENPLGVGVGRGGILLVDLPGVLQIAPMRRARQTNGESRGNPVADLRLPAFEGHLPRGRRLYGPIVYRVVLVDSGIPGLPAAFCHTGGRRFGTDPGLAG